MQTLGNQCKCFIAVALSDKVFGWHFFELIFFILEEKAYTSKTCTESYAPSFKSTHKG